MEHLVIFCAIYLLLSLLNLIFIAGIIYFSYCIYLERRRKNTAETKTQALIDDIATGFSLKKEENIAQSIEDLLNKLADFFMVETVLVHATDKEFAELIGSEHYSAGGTSILPQQQRTYMERWEDYLKKRSHSTDSLLYKDRMTKDRIKKKKWDPWVFIPLYKEEKIIAFLYIEASERPVWSEDQFVALPIISRIVSDAIEKVMSQMRICFMTYYDTMTKLPNRQHFYDQVDRAIRTARRENTSVGIMYLDLDSFKSINDTVGYEGGDQIIQDIGQKLMNLLDSSENVARFGGDEFLILLDSGADMDKIARVTEEIMNIFKDPVVLNGQEIFITASAGISVWPFDGEDAGTLIRHADIAMCTAKEKGKGRYAFCSPYIREDMEYRMNLFNSLYRALERNQLQVYYQPKIDLQTDRIVGSEALLRWMHPDYGMISPSEFIPLAEQSGLINQIGSWVLETACMQTMAWKAMGLGNLRIAVNLSVVQLRNPNLVAQVGHILTKTGIDPSMVELEITESAMTKEPDYIISVLNDLKSLGISISIDDFGTEYSSLNRLKMLPIDSLKMDIQFVQGIEKSTKDQAITIIIMNLAKNLDLKIVAEGVENSLQRDFLKSRMCDEVQGFYYYRPMPASEMQKVLS
jgi:diguanylate cyclase (GGDEF)-like protein